MIPDRLHRFGARAAPFAAALGFVAGLASIGLTGTALAADAAADETNIHHVSAEVCANCHQEIFKQWKGSMHANSTALSDPIHATFYKKVAGDPTEEGVVLKASGKFPVCLQCHAPNAAIDKTTKLDANIAYEEGVNCVACHTLAKFNGVDGPDGKLMLGLKSYEVSDTLQGPSGMNNKLSELASAGDDLFGGAGVGGADSQKPNPHLGEPVEYEGEKIPALPMEANPKLMKSSDACMGCHDQRNNPHGVPLCQTGNEYEQSESQVNCIACHMPIADGMANHTMGGGHDPAMLERAVIFDIDTEADGDNLKTTVYMKNQLPHSMPTGAPFRNVYLKLTAYDESGTVVWENAEGHPAKDDPQAYLSYSMTDDEGKPAMPPTATKPGEDTRLAPHEERTLVYEIPAKTVALVRGELYYNLLWPKLVENFSHLPKDLTDPVLIAVAENPVGKD
ncbi:MULTISPECIES: cytochrome c family protein [Thiorhodovibrio]|uniref:cytochrome c family protein n=1 Tax=Thiorhodovibrio TaxID=61593 RepID=UPI0019124C0C|nr:MULTISPECIES: cytochrome c family protein [Thiorhodovibrio]MBK5967817.1 cytochrome c family protein [Thiorhodovibrio winogradskyi]WPL14377.1 decaheme c-type cytochrome, OmcA/MtrC family [Thiorhodovibrio litoralis]